MDEVLYPDISERIKNKLSFFFTHEESFFFHFTKKLRKLGLGNGAILLEVSDGLRTRKEATAEQESFWVGDELEYVCDFIGTI